MPRRRGRRKKQDSDEDATGTEETSVGGYSAEDAAEDSVARPESKLTEQQKGELRAVFDSFDEDGSGFLCAPARVSARARRSDGCCVSLCGTERVGTWAGDEHVR